MVLVPVLVAAFVWVLLLRVVLVIVSGGGRGGCRRRIRFWFWFGFWFCVCFRFDCFWFMIPVFFDWRSPCKLQRNTGGRRRCYTCHLALALLVLFFVFLPACIFFFLLGMLMVLVLRWF